MMKMTAPAFFLSLAAMGGQAAAAAPVQAASALRMSDAGAPARSPLPAGPASEVDPLAFAPGEQPAATPAAGLFAGDGGAMGAGAAALGVDTPVKDICATRAGRAVLDRDMPGLTHNPMYWRFKRMTLRQLAGMSMGRIKDEDLQRVSQDLASLH